MSKRTAIVLLVTALCASCSATQTKFDWARYQPPDWRKYQAPSVRRPAQKQIASQSKQHSDLGLVTLGDLKSESDESLAQRLLGELGRRIAYIDRHPDRWRYYQGDGEAAESLDLYTHPEALGS